MPVLSTRSWRPSGELTNSWCCTYRLKIIIWNLFDTLFTILYLFYILYWSYYVYYFLRRLKIVCTINTNYYKLSTVIVNSSLQTLLLSIAILLFSYIYFFLNLFRRILNIIYYKSHQIVQKNFPCDKFLVLTTF